MFSIANIEEEPRKKLKERINMRLIAKILVVVGKVLSIIAEIIVLIASTKEKKS